MRRKGENIRSPLLLSHTSLVSTLDMEEANNDTEEVIKVSG